MDKRKPPISPNELNQQPASGRVSAVVATQPMAKFGRAIIAAAFVLIGVNDMSSHAISFESTQTGVAPEGWTVTLTGSGDPKWTVESDATAPSKSKVLKQSGRATYPLLLRNDASIKDGFVEVKFKAIAGSQDRAAGIIWRAKDANNYYVTRANALEDNVVLYKTVNGVRSALDIVGRKGGYGTSVTVPANIWHGLRVDFKGSRFSVSFNSKQLFEVEDSTFADAGKVGLWTKADSVTLFDEINYDETK
jgi:hypothetical protein